MLAAIFDVDGTLIDSVNLHARAWQDALRDYGHEVSLDDLRHQIGKGGDQLMPVYLSRAELAGESEALERVRADIYRARYMHDARPFPRVAELFRRLIADGKRIALASSANASDLRFYEKLAGIGQLLDAKTTTEDAARSKPHPDIFAAALERLGGMEPREVIVIGDTPYDAKAAAAAGMRTIGLTCGGWSEQELRAAGCIAVYSEPAALLDGYDESPLAGDA